MTAEATGRADDALARELAAIVSPAHCLVDPALTAPYEVDWTRRFAGRARLVVRPGSAAEVGRVLVACGAAGVAVVAQGGNTGLVGGGVPRGGEVVLSLRRLAGVERVDPEALLLEAGAGTTLADAQAAAAAVGCELGIDLAARDSATLGGMVATNAGGIHVIRHGPMRARLAGIEAVLADGSSFARLGGLVKDNVGYDLVGLLAGSEGTLGVVTKVLLRLVPVPKVRVAALVALSARPGPGGGTAALLSLVDAVRREVEGLEAAEAMYRDGLELVCAATGLAPPVGFPAADAWLLLEVGGPSDPTDTLAELLGAHPDVLDTAVATDAGTRAALWAYRERHTEAIATLGVAHKLDVCLPRAELATFEANVREVVRRAYPEARLVLFGHAGDGNLHVNVVGPPADDPGPDDLVLETVRRFGGSVSAEHGIGVQKRAWLDRSRDPADVAAMWALKRALDPRGILNPGAVFPGGQ